jgi:small subunit ribosomal protein S20
MPITKQAIKRMKQDRTRRARNKHYSSRMKSMMKLILGYLQKNEVEKAQKIHADVVKSIDTAAKKNLIHKNNAARKKSRIQRALTATKAGAKKATEPAKKEGGKVKEKAAA